MASRLACVLRLIECGHLNYPCSTEVDVTVALAAIDDAITADFRDAAVR